MSRMGKPSPAMLVAAIALVFAMAGTAIAGPDAASSAITKKKVKKIAKKQANKRITQREGELRVAHAREANFAVDANNAVNATLLGGQPANTLIRSAFSQIANDALVGPTGPANVRSTTITAAIKGFLLINAGSDVFGTGPSSPRCAIRVNGTIVPSSEREFRIDAANGNDEEDCTTETTVPVPAGTHTVDLFAVDGLPAGIRYDEAELQVLFVPFGATGAQPASAQKLSGGGDRGGN